MDGGGEMAVYSVTMRSHVGRDGVLKLEVPADLADVDVTVIVQPVALPADGSPEASGWPPGFFEQTFGCLRAEPLVRESQGEYETREGNMVRTFTLMYWLDDGWYVGKLKEVPGVFSQGATLQELEENVQEAYQLMVGAEKCGNMSRAGGDEEVVERG